MQILKNVRGFRVNHSFLDRRVGSGKYPTARWIQFCRYMMARDYVVFLYEAKKTNSKYLTVTYGNKKFTVRFSDHRPIRHRELAGDCDFFVGVTNTGVRDIVDAIEACLRYFDDVPEIRKIDRSDLDKMAKKEQGEAPKENAR